MVTKPSFNLYSTLLFTTTNCTELTGSLLNMYMLRWSIPNLPFGSKVIFISSVSPGLMEVRAISSFRHSQFPWIFRISSICFPLLIRLTVLVWIVLGLIVPRLISLFSMKSWGTAFRFSLAKGAKYSKTSAIKSNVHLEDILETHFRVVSGED